MTNNSPNIILASSSPRRSMLLESIGLSFTVFAPDVDESRRDDETIVAYAKRLAEEKALAIQATADDIVIAADTTGEVDGVLLTKPDNLDDAKKMLRLLSGRVHEIHTAFCVRKGARLQSKVVCSRVRMRVMTDAEIEAYWQTGEPKDKAGAYAIQGLGSMFVQHLEGSFSGVMGLPLFELCEALSAFAVPLLRKHN